MDEKPVCENCGSTHIIPILYGCAASPVFRAAMVDVALVVTKPYTPGLPLFHCRDCGQEFGSEDNSGYTLMEHGGATVH